MKYVDEFRDPVAARGVIATIQAALDRIGASETDPVRIMEICGGHTHAIFRHGLDRLIGPALGIRPRSRLPGLRAADAACGRGGSRLPSSPA